MDFSFSASDLAFRDEVRAFIAANLSPEAARGERLNPASVTEKAVFGSWQAALYKRGWVVPFWPVEHGGPGWTPTQRYIFEAECGRAGTPYLLAFGFRLAAPVIMRFGSPEQKAFYLPRMMSGEDYWCQGYSEPGAGSDLASLRTKAVRQGDHYVVNGTKIWTTHAHFANRMFALVRTSDTPRPQEGISFLLIDLTLPGVSIRPIITIGGDHEVNQVFFDDVRVPTTDLVGEENKGWTYAKYLLEFERGAGFRSTRLRYLLTQAKLRCAKTSDPAAMANRISEIEIDIDTLEMMELMTLADIQNGRNPGPISSMLKLRMSEIYQALDTLSLDLLGERVLIWEDQRPLHDLVRPSMLEEDELVAVPAYLNGRARTIFAGASEVQREIIAKRILGL